MCAYARVLGCLVLAFACARTDAMPFKTGDRVAVFGPSESPRGADVPARLQLSWNLTHPGVAVDFVDATYRRDALPDGFRRWTLDVVDIQPTHVLSLFGPVPGSAGFEHDLRLFVRKARSEGICPVLALPETGADIVRRVASEEQVPLVDLAALLTQSRADAPAKAVAAYDGLVAGERTLRVFHDMRFAAQAHGMYLGDNLPDQAPTEDAWKWWLKDGHTCRSNEVERWKTLYGHETDWRKRTEDCRAELRKELK